jgi:hypothetical protein
MATPKEKDDVLADAVAAAARKGDFDNAAKMLTTAFEVVLRKPQILFTYCTAIGDFGVNMPRDQLDLFKTPVIWDLMNKVSAGHEVILQRDAPDLLAAIARSLRFAVQTEYNEHVFVLKAQGLGIVAKLLTQISHLYGPLLPLPPSVYKELLFTCSKGLMTAARCLDNRSLASLALVFSRLQTFMPFTFQAGLGDEDDCLEAMCDALVCPGIQDIWNDLEINQAKCCAMLAANLSMLVERSEKICSRPNYGLLYCFAFPIVLELVFAKQSEYEGRILGNYETKGVFTTLRRFADQLAAYTSAAADNTEWQAFFNFDNRLRVLRAFPAMDLMRVLKKSDYGMLMRCAIRVLERRIEIKKRMEVHKRHTSAEIAHLEFQRREEACGLVCDILEGQLALRLPEITDEIVACGIVDFTRRILRACVTDGHSAAVRLITAFLVYLPSRHLFDPDRDVDVFQSIMKEEASQNSATRRKYQAAERAMLGVFVALVMRYPTFIKAYIRKDKSRAFTKIITKLLQDMKPGKLGYATFPALISALGAFADIGLIDQFPLTDDLESLFLTIIATSKVDVRQVLPAFISLAKHPTLRDELACCGISKMLDTVLRGSCQQAPPHVPLWGRHDCKLALIGIINLACRFRDAKLDFHDHKLTTPVVAAMTYFKDDRDIAEFGFWALFNMYCGMVEDVVLIGMNDMFWGWLVYLMKQWCRDERVSARACKFVGVFGSKEMPGYRAMVRSLEALDILEHSAASPALKAALKARFHN